MSSEPSDAALSAYLSESTSWDADRVAEARRSVVRAWRIAAAACLCATASTVALVVVVPLHRIEPFLVRVDASTGVVDVVPVYSGRAVLPETVTRYFLSHYVQTCERFNFATAESDYEECGAFHTAQRNQAWYALWTPSNASSPLNIHRDGSSVSVQIESLSFFKRANGGSDLAQVRYVRAERQSSGAPERVTHWIATVQYAYGAPSTDARMRAWNPLGFKVLEFLAEPEIQREPSATSPPLGGRSAP
jgi:type IV secretion system protein VirB8